MGRLVGLGEVELDSLAMNLPEGPAVHNLHNVTSALLNLHGAARCTCLTPAIGSDPVGLACQYLKQTGPIPLPWGRPCLA